MNINIINNFERKNIKNNYNININEFNTGFYIKVDIIIDILNDKKKIQSFSGVLIAIKRKGILTNIIVRKISNNIGVEKIFYIYSPNIFKISILKKNFFRKSKLYFLRKSINNKLHKK